MKNVTKTVIFFFYISRISC